MAAESRPVLIYDGDCSFCIEWLGFWRALAGESVEYIPSQDAIASGRFPELTAEDCRKAVQFITPRGRWSGAEAVGHLLDGIPGYGWFLWCMRFIPGFAALASFGYNWIAGHRGFALGVTRVLWGVPVRPSTWYTASDLFSRILAIVYAIAFASFGLQGRGLVGSEGILPTREFLEAVYRQLGAVGMWRLPTIFWWGNSDIVILSIAWGGVVLSLMSLVAKRHSRWQRIIFIVLWVYYLSIVNAGQVFMAFQWDWLLVEAGFIAIFLRPSRARTWLFRWLLFRLMFESGAVKLLSGDASWHNLTALQFHYATQPLPTPLAWYAHLAPAWFQQFSAVVVFVVELGIPFLIFGPRRLRQIAGTAIIALQVLILLTGNYTFFNLLTIALCLFLFDDACFARWKLASKPIALRPPLRAVTAVVWTLVAFLSGVELWSLAGKVPEPLVAAQRQVSQFGLVNHYGLFAVMTTKRMEIQIEASLDGQTWQPYLFRYKPGPLSRRPPWVAPYQPRLDWQMWFAALSGARDNPWFIRTMVGLLRDSKEVKALFEQTPFGGAQVKFLRATIYEYHFTDWEERQKTGNYWKRELKGLYFPEISLEEKNNMSVSPLAGKPAPSSLLIDVERLIGDYYSKKPDPGNAAQLVSFGTSGHRGTPTNATFTEQHILAITQAICEYRNAQGTQGPVFMGMDTHAVSAPAQKTALEVLAANGVDVIIQPGGGFTPTPAVSRAILAHNHGRKSGIADGIVITPSHNPPNDGGFKYNPPNGGPAGPEVTGVIQKRANELLAGGNRDVRRVAYDAAAKSPTTHEQDYIAGYVEDLSNVIDMEAIRSSGIAIGVDPLGGASLAYWEPIAERYGLQLQLVNKKVDPQFGFMTVDHDGKIRMDCSSPYAMASLVNLKDDFEVAWGCDPDSDRHGIVTPGAGLMNPNHYLATAIQYLVTHRPQWPASVNVGKTLVSSSMIDRVTAGLGRTLMEVPVGFKFFADGLYDGSCCFGGEESAGASFLRRDGNVWTTDKDGLILGLLAAEITAVTGKDPGEHYRELTAKYGEFFYARVDTPANATLRARLKQLSPEDIKATELAGNRIESRQTSASGAPIGGLKVITAEGWFAARPSGTEDIYKLYAESFVSGEHLDEIITEARKMVLAALG